MSASDRLKWDTRYRDRDRSAELSAPDPLLLQFTPPLRQADSATALDLASGVGQNGLWLAEQGYVVDLIDISRVALTHARDEAARRHLRRVNFFQSDLDDGGLEAQKYDLVAVFRFLNRDLMPMIRMAVKPEGRILYQTFNTRYLQINPNFAPEFLLGVGELAGFFGDWKVLHNSEYDHISRLVAIKPNR